MTEYLYIADPDELAKTERALWEARRLATLQELMRLYPGKGWHLGMQSIDRSLDGTPSPKQYTTALVAPIVDSAQPGGLILVDQHVLALQGVAVDVKIGDKPAERVAIDVSAKRERASLPAAWQAVLTKLETPVGETATPVGEPTQPPTMLARVVSASAPAAGAGATVATGLAVAGFGPTIIAAGGAAAALVMGAVAFFKTGGE